MNDEDAGGAIEVAFRHLSELPTLHIYGEKARASMLGYGWWARIVRTGEAIRRLHAAGLGHEAAPLVRAVLDHTTALIWLAQERYEAVDAYEWHRHWKQSSLVATGEKLEWDLEVDEVPEAPERTAGRLGPPTSSALRGWPSMSGWPTSTWASRSRPASSTQACWGLIRTTGWKRA